MWACIMMLGCVLAVMTVEEAYDKLRIDAVSLEYQNSKACLWYLKDLKEYQSDIDATALETLKAWCKEKPEDVQKKARHEFRQRMQLESVLLDCDRTAVEQLAQSINVNVYLAYDTSMQRTPLHVVATMKKPFFSCDRSALAQILLDNGHTACPQQRAYNGYRAVGVFRGTPLELARRKNRMAWKLRRTLHRALQQHPDCAIESLPYFFTYSDSSFVSHMDSLETHSKRLQQRRQQPLSEEEEGDDTEEWAKSRMVKFRENVDTAFKDRKNEEPGIFDATEIPPHKSVRGILKKPRSRATVLRASSPKQRLLSFTEPTSLEE